jgi:hypothetical protein
VRDIPGSNLYFTELLSGPVRFGISSLAVAPMAVDRIRLLPACGDSVIVDAEHDAR